MESTAQVQHTEVAESYLVPCNHCGFSNPESVQYCWRCGNRLKKRCHESSRPLYLRART